jgi:hypothetical protein
MALEMYCGDEPPRKRRASFFSIQEQLVRKERKEFQAEKEKQMKKALELLVMSLKRVAVVLCNSLLNDQLKSLDQKTLREIVNEDNIVGVVQKMKFSVHDFCDVCYLLKVKSYKKTTLHFLL